ncbi:MAG TPA: hypothetical protein VFZ33_06430 [Chitinophagaceae bacterium]
MYVDMYLNGIQSIFTVKDPDALNQDQYPYHTYCYIKYAAGIEMQGNAW